MASEKPWIRSADSLLGPAVAETLSKLPNRPEDAAIAKLAERYAAVIDNADSEDTADRLSDFGPKLKAVLVELQATPRARASVKGVSDEQEQSASGKLAAIRGARAS